MAISLLNNSYGKLWSIMSPGLHLIMPSPQRAEEGKRFRFFLLVIPQFIKNLEGKAEELDEAYKKLREEFERISKISEEE